MSPERATRPVSTTPGDRTRAPRVSVVVPLFQKERYIGRTVASVLGQTFDDFELVVLDNACTDASAEIVASFRDPRVRLEHNDATVPAPENFDRAVRLARAPLVKVLMADDLLAPTLLAEQVPLMEADPSLALVSCRHDLVDDDDRVIVTGRALGSPDLIGPRDGATVLRRIVRHRGNPIGAPGNMLFRRDAYDACGGFPADTYVLDVGLAARLVTQGRFYGMPESLSQFRLATGSLTSSHRRANTATQHAFLRTLRREHRGVVRRRDVAYGMVREPLTWLRSQLIAAASTDPASRRHRVASAALGRRPVPPGQRGVANTTMLSR
ncbi:glycosyltransferase family 2 protein [Actinomycetospora soli]|uniref:glycosyltransferase family 2 protein n=1 Tax=Actinomycetospora soli TaxID=2893887 RepID=UPI001E5B2114|nr:glycosyltransferase family 2 protein [Actinomycetospora soli]MCD2187962.1 glycosyltransferase [Actinomycetospora soli]